MRDKAVLGKNVMCIFRVEVKFFLDIRINFIFIVESLFMLRI